MSAVISAQDFGSKDVLMTLTMTSKVKDSRGSKGRLLLFLMIILYTHTQEVISTTSSRATSTDTSTVTSTDTSTATATDTSTATATDTSTATATDTSTAIATDTSTATSTDTSTSSSTSVPDCGAPIISNGQHSGTTTIGSNVTFSCNQSYSLLGPASAVCNQNGSWTLLPTCIRDCGVPSVANAQRTVSSTTLGSNVTFTCETSYVLQGNPTSTCEANGLWTPLPTCIRDCGVPLVANAQRTGSSTTLGSNVTFTCDTSYVLQGNPTSTCGANGSWSFLPSCSYQCEAVADLINGKVVKPCSIQKCTAVFTCNSTHDLIGQNAIVCVPGGWSHEWPKCRLKDQLKGSLISITLSIKPPKNEQGLKRFMDELGARLYDHFKAKMGSDFESVQVHSISRPGVAIISFFIGNTNAAKASFATSMASLIKGESFDVLGDPAKVNAATLESGQPVVLNQTAAEMSCAIYEQIQGICPSQTQCKVVDTKPTCEPLTTQDKDSTASSSKAGMIAGSIVGGLIGLVAIVMTVVAHRKYELICKCVHKPESTGKALYEAPAVSAIDNGEYESIGNRNDIRRNQPDINSSGNDSELGTNAYDSLDAHQSSKHVYSELGRQPRTDQTRLYENTAVQLDSGTAVYVNTTFENA